MNLNSALAKSLLMAASVGMVVPMFAQTTPKPVAPAAPAKPAPSKPAAPKEEPATIEGLELPRKAGGFVGVTIDGVRLVVKFYDAEKKPVAADVARAVARWNPVNKTGEVRSVLNPAGDGTSLVSTPVLQPPHVFNVYLTLIAQDGTAVETYVVNLREATKAKE
jgi:hypothetical protein